MIPALLILAALLRPPLGAMVTAELRDVVLGPLLVATPAGGDGDPAPAVSP